MRSSCADSSLLRKFLTGLIAFFALSLFLGVLNKTGKLIVLWDAEPLHQVEPNQGQSYYAPLGRPELVRFGLPVSLQVGEAILPNPILSVNEDLISTIATHGGGRYTLDPSGSLVFSIPDGSAGELEFDDVRALIPVFSFRTIYLIGLAFGFICAVFTAIVFDRRLGKSIPDQLCKEASYAASVIAAALIVLTILPTDNFLRTIVPFRIFGELYVLPFLKRDAFVLGMILLAIFRTSKRFPNWKPLRITAVAGLIAGIVYAFAPTFGYLGFRVDSAEYLQPYSAASLRTPGYPDFIEGTIGAAGREGLEFWRSDEGVQEATAMGEMVFMASDVRYGDSLIKPIHAQKLFLIGMFLFVLVVLWKAGDFWLAYGFGVIALGVDFLGVYNDYFMSEVLAQSLMLLAAGVFLTLIFRRRAELMIGLGIVAGLTFLVRPAGLVLGLLMLIASVALVWELRTKRMKTFLFVGMGWGVFVGLCSIPGFVILRDSGRFIWTPNANYVSIANAVQLMDSTDVIEAEDGEARTFLETCLELRVKLEGPGVQLSQNTAMWDVAVTAAESMGYARIQANVLFGKAANRILLRHATAYRDLILGRIQAGLARSRIHLGRLSALTLTAILFLLGLLRRSAFSIAGLTLIALHGSHFLLSMQNQPERRYIWSTEIFFVLGAALIVYDFLRPVIQPGKRSGSRD